MAARPTHRSCTWRSTAAATRSGAIPSPMRGTRKASDYTEPPRGGSSVGQSSGLIRDRPWPGSVLAHPAPCVSVPGEIDSVPLCEGPCGLVRYLGRYPTVTANASTRTDLDAKPGSIARHGILVDDAGVNPDVAYARNGKIAIAYEAVGDGPIDLVYLPGFINNLE